MSSRKAKNRTKSKANREPAYSRHHLIPQSRAIEGFEVQHELNIKRLRHQFHKRIHRLFDNLTPQEQLAMWLDVNQAILEPEVRKTIQDLVNQTREDFYIDDVIAGKVQDIEPKNYNQSKCED